MADMALLLEAEKRGLLPADKIALLAEARKRGIVPALNGSAPPANAEPGFGEKLGNALAGSPSGAIEQLGKVPDIISGAAKYLYSDGTNGTLAGRLMDTAKAVPGALADEAGGMLQYMRNLSPENMRGSAPTLPGGEAKDHPYLAAMAGDSAPILNDIEHKPLTLIGDALMGMGATAPGRAMLGKGADLAMTPVRGTVRAIRDMTPTRRAQIDLLNASRAGGSDPQTIAALLEGKQSPVPGVNLSAAQTAQNSGMAQLEKASRGNPAASPMWTNFDTAQNTGMFNALSDIVNPADDVAVATARTARDDATKYNRQTALALAEQGQLESGALTPPKVAPKEAPLAPRESIGPHGERIIDIPDPNARPPINDTLGAAGQPGLETSAADRGQLYLKPVQQAMDTQLGGARGALPSVQRLVDWLKKPGTLDTPERAYEARKVIADSLNAKTGVPLDELGSSVKSAGVSAKALKTSIDSALNDASGGIWQDYLDGFKANSKDVNSVEALNDIRAELEARVAGKGANDLAGNPKLTRSYINWVIEKADKSKYGPRIAPDIKSKLNDIRKTAQDIEAPLANYRAGATGGGGTDTAATLALAGANHLATAVGGPLARTAMATMQGIGANRGATMLADLLQNPRNAATALRTAAERERLRAAVRSSGITPAALAAALNAQPAQPQQ